MFEENKPVRKSRDLSINQFFETLQEEYIICELRVKIFPYEDHKKYWRDIAAKKKVKILDIAKRNLLPCIFDDKRIKQDYEKKIIVEVGFPKFYYIDDKHKDTQAMWDKRNYYSKDAEVKVIEEGKVIVGKIDKVYFTEDGGTITVNIDGVLRDFDISIVTRIFSQLEIKY